MNMQKENTTLPIKSGLRLVSVKKLSFSSRPKGKFFTSDSEFDEEEFGKLGEKSEILAGGSWPAVWLHLC